MDHMINLQELKFILPTSGIMALLFVVWKLRGHVDQLVTKEDFDKQSVNVNTALKVLGDHGTEIKEVNSRVTNVSERLNHHDVRLHTVEKKVADH